MDAIPLADLWPRLILVVVLVLINGFFVAAELSMVRVRATRIDQLAQEGNRQAKRAQRVIENIYDYLPATQLGVTLASLALGWVGESTIQALLDDLFHGAIVKWFGQTIISIVSIVLAFLIITFFHIVVGELVPKAFAIQRAERTALSSAVSLDVFYKVTYPIIWLLNLGATGILRLFGMRPATGIELAHNEEELRMLVSQSHESGVIDETERALFHNIFDFSTRVAREIMVPRTDMICLYADRTFQENLEKVDREKHTRFPLCLEDKDHIVGIVHVKDLYTMALTGNNDYDLTKSVRPFITVPEAMPIKDVLRILQKNRSEMAVVIDEYGGTAGILTTEDILEELVGEIQDEFDEERPFIEELPQGLSIDARMLIDDVNDLFHLDLEAEEVDTIGGYVYNQFETIPTIGEKVRIGDYTFQIKEMDLFRITRLLAIQDQTEHADEQITLER